MNTPEMMEFAEIALLRAKIELQCIDDRSLCIDVPARAHVRRSTIAAVQRVLDAMRSTVAAVPVVAVLLGSAAWDAQAADQTAAIAKAEQAVVLATCKLNFLRDRPGAKKNDKDYFGYMFQCLSK